MSDKTILTLQVSGFLAAPVLWFFHAPHALFIIAFGVHLVGDIFRAKKDGLLNEFLSKISGGN